MQNISYSPPRPDEIAEMDRMLEQALIFSVGSMAEWTQAIGHEHMRVIREHDRVIAGIGVIPFGHWFGGRVVAAGGVTAVGVAPDRRGSGVGLMMLRHMLAEQHKLGVPISTLYPATTNFYRRAGYERAAQRLIYEIPLHAIGLRDYRLAADPHDPADIEPLRAIYNQRAACSASFIDRPDMLWKRIHAPSHKPGYTFVVRRNGTPEGYINFLHASWGEPLVVRDSIALTPAAGRRLLTILADHRSMLEKVRIPGGPHDPLCFLIPEQTPKVFSSLDLMLRIVDLPAALAARGYPEDLSGELHLEVTDDLLPWNNGRFVLQIANGTGRVEPGGTGGMQVHIRDLAALYSGYYTPDELRFAGSIQSDAASLAAARPIFAGPRPWLQDMF
ncbi:MAG: GNAT family N-acetyltransferase [Oscillochloris sp.]|nr:GNAT family N-acetyltransferase [Oscillochloris sp.]